MDTITTGLFIGRGVTIPWSELEIRAVRAQGAGGQNVNKVSSAIHLRFSVPNSSIPPSWKERLLATADQRLTQDGVLIIKAQQFRTQEQNREDAIARLRQILLAASTVPKPRMATRPTLASKKRRVESKVKRGQIKALRGKVD